MKPVLILDFDGTIANTRDAIIDIMNGLADELGFRKIEQKDIEYLRGKKPKAILKHLGISLFKAPFVIRKTRKKINASIATLEPSVDWLPVLQSLKQQGCHIGIVTTNTEENVKKFLHANNLDLFDFFYTAGQIFGKDKIISKIIHNMKFSDIYFVGDEIRDMEAGKKAKVKTVAVSWGYNTAESLQKENPDYIIDSPQELEKIIFK